MITPYSLQPGTRVTRQPQGLRCLVLRDMGGGVYLVAEEFSGNWTLEFRDGSELVPGWSYSGAYSSPFEREG